MRRLIALLLLGLTGACSDSLPPDTSFAGTYALRSYDGNALPYTVYEWESDFAQLTAGELSLAANHTFRASLTITVHLEGVTETVVDAISGTFTRRGNSFVLKDLDGESYDVTYDGESQLTLALGESRLVFRR